MMMIPFTRSSILFLFVVLLLLQQGRITIAADLHLDGYNPNNVDSSWDINRWYVQVDGVMGGKSSGFLNFVDNNKIMSFSGDIVLDGGGFSSVRGYLDESIDLSNYAGIVIEMESHTYNAANPKAPLGLHFQLHDTTSRWGYASAFAIPLANNDTATTSVFLPMETFDRATRAGWRCQNPNSCILDTSKINEMDVYVLFQEGGFDVNIKSITAVTNVTSFRSPSISIKSTNEILQLIQSTIKSGGKLYDYGYQELCIAIYRSTLNTLLASSDDSDVITDTINYLICFGLQEAATFDRTELIDIAWSLRGTLDDIIEAIENYDEDGDVLMPIVSSSRTTPNNMEKGEELLTCMAVTSFPPVYDDEEIWMGNITEGNYTR